jgi:hypothetical protein
MSKNCTNFVLKITFELYYRNPLINVKYVVSINGTDPDEFYLLNPSKETFDKNFSPLSVWKKFGPLVARRYFQREKHFIKNYCF